MVGEERLVPICEDWESMYYCYLSICLRNNDGILNSLGCIQGVRLVVLCLMHDWLHGRTTRSQRQ